MLSFFDIFKHQLRNIVNIFMFLPYYFNVQAHLRYLFAPWKRIVSVKKQRGFSMEELLERLSWDFVSRGMGFTMRLTVILTYLVVIAVYTVIAVPVWLLVGALLTPLSYLLQQLIVPARQQRKQQESFVKSHSLDEKNAEAVAAWFERTIARKVKDADTFALENLLTIPPIGRDWSYGYTPTLDSYSKDLTTGVTSQKLTDRVEEIRSIERSLARSYEANVIVVGEEGVGKHAIIGGFADRIYNGKTIPPLQNLRILELDMERVLSNGSSHEEKVELLSRLLEEAALAQNIIVVVNNFHSYCSASLVGDYSDLWEKFGKSPRVKFVAITTPFYFQHIIFHNEKIARLFTKLDVAEVSPEKALLILEEKTVYLEHEYGVLVPYETIQHIIARSTYYITHIPFPEKAISLLDEVCSYVKESRVAGHGSNESRVMPDDVDAILSQKTHAPIGKMRESTKHTLLNLVSLLKKTIIGQDNALTQVTHAIQRAYIEENRTKPKASLLFLGPTGVGKTETAKALAEIFFGKKDAMTRFDMSFYQDERSMKDLIGSFDSGNPGLLAEKIREKPYAVLLIDEIEKAHKDVLNIFLTLLDEGYMVDGFGKKVDCKNLIIIATSNAGAHEIYDWTNQGISGEGLEKEVRQMVIDKNLFAPEFLNRFDKVLVYEPIKIEDAVRIAYAVLSKVQNEYQQQKNITLDIANSEVETWVRDVFNSANGVREIERVIREKFAEKAAGILLQ